MSSRGDSRHFFFLVTAQKVQIVGFERQHILCALLLCHWEVVKPFCFHLA